MARRGRDDRDGVLGGNCDLGTGDFESYGYDLIGNRTKLRKRDGAELTYVYDNLNRVIRKIVPERPHLTAAQTRDVYYDYNHALGLQTKARFDGLDGYGVTNYYDQFGQPTTTLLTMDGQPGHYRYVSYYHDDAGNMVRFTHPDGVDIGYAYDPAGRTTLIQENRASPSLDDLIVRYWYNSAGSRHSAVRGAGSGGFYTVYYRDPLQRPTILANDLPAVGDNPIELAYNPAGQITSRTISNDSYVWTGAYNVSRAYAANGLNQYISAGPASFTYDANGNLTSDGTTSYVYDVENRLVSASNGASLAYDPLGRLVQVSSPGGPATHFYYDRDKVIAEYDGSGSMTKRYVHGPGADEPVAVYQGAALGLAGRRYTMPDERGSIVGLVNADGSPSVYNTYDSWGIPGAGNAGRFQYTGQAWIPELGMYHYKARIYSPTLGRFLQTDPIGYEDQINLYAYVGNDPVNKADPTGKAGQCDTGSRIAGNSSFCMVADGFSIAGEEAAPPSRGPHGPRAYGSGGKGSGVPGSVPPKVPGGPYEPKPNVPGNRPGSFQSVGKGLRTQAQWVPPEGQGGPKGSKGYWKVQEPGQKGWQRCNNQGRPLTQAEAHPSVEESSAWEVIKMPFKIGGIIVCALLCESAANAPAPSSENDD